MSIHKTTSKTGSKYLVKLRRPDGTQYSKTFRTRKQAEAFQTSEKNAMNTNAWLDDRNAKTTFGMVAERWLGQNIAKRQRTLDRDTSILQRHILPTIGARQISKIKKPELQTLVTTWTSQGLKPRTIKRQVAVMKAVFQRAIDDDLIVKTPARALKYPAAEPVEHHPLSAQEVIKLLESITPFYRPMIYIFLSTGLRWSELAGLQIKDAQLLQKPPKLKIERGLHQTSKGIKIEAPKTPAGRRTISLTTTGAEVIAGHIATTGRTMAQNEQPMFVSPNGHTLNYSNFRNRVWKPALKQCGLEHIDIHDLRRTTATVLVAQQIDAKTIQEIMGHSDIRTTFNLYASSTPQGHQKATEALGAYLNNDCENETKDVL